MTETGCLSAEMIVRYVEGGLDADSRSRVVRHADSCDACREAMSLLAAGSPASAETVPAVPQPRGTSGPAAAKHQTLGRYVIKDVLGSGGMGVVYRAHDPELGRQVALKVVRPSGDSSASSASRGRLVREAQAMAKLAHPNVIVVHDAGTVGDDVFVAMELVDGTDLATWERAEPRPWRETIDVYRQAARGLAAAHRVGIVHRDFKPANALLGTDGRVRVLDFGLARTVDDATQETARRTSDLDLTQTGAVMGTPLYMSPEQHLGERADARSDQFSLCVALYHALYGAFPFEGRTYAALADAVTTRAPAPPPRGTSVPGAVGKVVMRGLARERQDRFASIDELIAALDHALPRRRAHLVVPAVLSVAAIATAAYVLVRRERAPSAPVALAFTRNHQAVTTSGEHAQTLDLSPDGKRLAWATATGVAFRDLATGATTERPERSAVTSLRWSPSGDSVLLATNRGPTLFSPERGEEHVFMVPVNSYCAADWLDEARTILWYCNPVEAPMPWLVVDVATGKTEELAIDLPATARVVDFDVSAAGIAIATEDGDRYSLVVADRRGKLIKQLAVPSKVSSVRWNARGTGVFMVRHAAQGYDLVRRELAAPDDVLLLPQPVGTYELESGAFTVSSDERVIYYVQSRVEDDIAFRELDSATVTMLTADHRRKSGLSVTPDGRLVACGVGSVSRKQLFTLDRSTGAVRLLDGLEGNIRWTAFSPDALALAVLVAGAEADHAALWIVSLDGSAPPRALTLPPLADDALTWTTAGSIVVATSTREQQLRVDPASGTSASLFDAPLPDIRVPTVSADGSVVGITPGDNMIPVLVRLTPPSTRQSVIKPELYAQSRLAFSTDGEWLYVDDRPPDDQRVRVVAIDAHGMGRSRLIANLGDGWDPQIVDHERAAIWVVSRTISDIWQASAEPRPQLALGPPTPPRPKRPQPSVGPSPQNLQLAGEPGHGPTGWDAVGQPTPATLATDCGRPGACVVLDGASSSAIGQRFDATAFRGRRVRLTFDARVDTDAMLDVTVRSGIPDSTRLDAGWLSVRAQPWQRREMIADVAPDATYVEIAARAENTGRAWIADFSLELLP